jgi:hypothetical protein
MGGWGSGRQGGRVTIEGCGSCRLSVRDLRGLLRHADGVPSWITYRRNGEHLMTVVVEACLRFGYLRLQHPSRASDRGEEGMDYTVGLTATTPSFGGGRWWFCCPVSGRRCAVLYLPQGARKFACARAYGLVYAVTRMPEHDRLWHRMAKITRRLGDEPDPEIPPCRPRGMRRLTYERLLEDWHWTAARRDAIFDAKLAGFAAQLERLRGRPGE